MQTSLSSPLSTTSPDASPAKLPAHITTNIRCTWAPKALVKTSRWPRRFACEWQLDGGTVVVD